LGLTLAAPASAQSLHKPRTVAPLSITSDASGTRFEIQRLSDLVPLAKCVDECRVLLAVDQYRLVVHGSDGVASGGRMFELDAPVRMQLTPDAPWQRWTGLSLVVVGTVAKPWGHDACPHRKFPRLRPVAARQSAGCRRARGAWRSQLLDPRLGRVREQLQARAEGASRPALKQIAQSLELHAGRAVRRTASCRPTGCPVTAPLVPPSMPRSRRRPRYQRSTESTKARQTAPESSPS